jgi:ABC-type Co2+ transport system permease subunit
MDERGAGAVDMLVGAAIATAIAVVTVLVVSRFVPFPWGLGPTLVAIAIASFSGSVVSYLMGARGGDNR